MLGKLGALCQPRRAAVYSKQMFSCMEIKLIKRAEGCGDVFFFSPVLWVCCRAGAQNETPWPVIAPLNACFMSCPGRLVELWSCLFQQHFHYLFQSLFSPLLVCLLWGNATIWNDVYSAVCLESAPRQAIQSRGFILFPLFYFFICLLSAALLTPSVLADYC